MTFLKKNKSQVGNGIKLKYFQKMLLICGINSTFQNQNSFYCILCTCNEKQQDLYSQNSFQRPKQHVHEWEEKDEGEKRFLPEVRHDLDVGAAVKRELFDKELLGEINCNQKY